MPSFTVRPRHPHGRHARAVDESTAEAAAIAYLEDYGGEPDEDDVVAVVVRDAETGREQCFRVDLNTGETAPCSA